VLAVLSSALRNVLMKRKRTTTDFFINPPFASGRARTGRNYSNLAGSHGQGQGIGEFCAGIVTKSLSRA
jgi:hypothetical protein